MSDVEKPAISLKAAATEQTSEAKVVPPEEMFSMNKSVNIVKDGKEVMIVFSPTIVEEIGAYRRCKVNVKFTQGGSVQIIPVME